MNSIWNGFISSVERSFFRYQEEIDKIAASLLGKSPADVDSIDRALLIPASVLSMAGCTSDPVCESKSEIELGLANDGIDNNCDGLVDEVVIKSGEVTLKDLEGKHDLVHIKSGGKLFFTSKEVNIDTKKFILEKNAMINIGGTSCGLGDGLEGKGEYDGGGGGGGSYATLGGSGGNGGWKGVGMGGGIVYASSSEFKALPGSCGGRGGGPYGGSSGGKGGGAITINAEDAIIYGTIYAQGYSGKNAVYDDGGQGGGSGGSIFLNFTNLNLDSASSAFCVFGGNGGNGGSFSQSGGGGGGGGSGGKVAIKFKVAKIMKSLVEDYFTMNDKKKIEDILTSSMVYMNGGAGGAGGCGAQTCGKTGSNGEKGILQLFD